MSRSSELPHAEAVKLLKLYFLRLPDSSIKLAMDSQNQIQCRGSISTGVNSLRTVGTKYQYASQQYIPIAANPRGTIHPLPEGRGFLNGFAYPLTPYRKNSKFFWAIIENDSGWADFFITRIGLILFAAVLLLAAFKVYPMFQEQETRAYLDVTASDIASKIEAVDSTTIPEHKYIYVFDEKNKDIKIEISTEYVVARGNLSMGERELIHAEPIVTHVYPPNSKWSNTSGLREYLSKEIGKDKNGDASSHLNFSMDKGKVDSMFDSIQSELARNPFRPDTGKPLFIEKVIIYYNNQEEILERDYALVYQ